MWSQIVTSFHAPLRSQSAASNLETQNIQIRPNCVFRLGRFLKLLSQSSREPLHFVLERLAVVLLLFCAMKPTIERLHTKMATHTPCWSSDSGRLHSRLDGAVAIAARTIARAIESRIAPLQDSPIPLLIRTSVPAIDQCSDHSECVSPSYIARKQYLPLSLGSFSEQQRRAARDERVEWRGLNIRGSLRPVHHLGNQVTSES